MEQSGNSKTLSERRFSKAEHWASANADGQHSRRCATASPPSGHGPPMGQKTVLRTNNPLSAEHTDPLAGGCAERAPVPDRDAVSRLTLKQTPDRDLVLERNGSPKTTSRREFRSPGPGPGRTPTAGAAAGAPLAAVPDALTHQWAKKPHFDPKNTYQTDSSAHY